MTSKKFIFIMSFFMILLCLGTAAASQDIGDGMKEVASEAAGDAVSVETDERVEYVNGSDTEPLAVGENDELMSDEDDGVYLDPSEAYECLNAYRAEKGAWFWDADNEHVYYFNTHEANQLKPLEIDPKLEEAAKIRAKEISILFEHERPDGTDCFTIYPDEGYFAHGENIARFYSTGAAATEAWKENYLPFSEQGHRRSMLSSYYDCVGIAGYYSPSKGFFWVQAFGAKSDEANEPETQFDLTKATLTDLSDLIRNGGEIRLEKDYAYNGSEIKDGIVIDKNVVVDGCGHSVDGMKLARIFNITADNVVLKNIRLINGYVDNDYGGAILSSCANLTLINCSFSNNFAYYGGAVSATGNLTIEDCELTDNIAVEGTIYCRGCDVTLKNSDFKENMAILYGGVISLDDCFEIVENCTFADNKAYKGAAIYSGKNEGRIKDSTFSRNTAEVQGGALYLSSAIDIENCTFTKNVADSNVHPQEGGGAVFLNASGASIKKSRFIDNGANVYGGAVFLIEGDVSIEECEFTANHLTRGYSNHGGAICSSGSANIVNCNFKNNSADNGGAIFSKEGSIIIRNSNISSSRAENGGAIYVTDTYVELENSHFSHNLAENGGALNLEQNCASIKNCGFLNNTAGIGGCLYLSGDEFTIDGCNFKDSRTNGTWVGDGAAAYILKGKTTVSNSCFTNSSTYSEGFATKGGAVFLSCLEGVFTGCSFKSNGAVYGGDIYSTESDVSCIACDFSHSDSNIGASLYSDKGNLTVRDCDVYSNSPVSGSIYSENGNLSVFDSRFCDNAAKNGGGAIYTSNSTVNVWDSSFVNNSRYETYSIMGGSIYSFYANVNIFNSNFTDGVADSAAALYMNQLNLTVENCRFENNTACGEYRASGAAAYILGSDAAVKDCVFKGNNVTAAYYSEGGSIYSRNTKISLKDSIFSKESAESGAAVFSEEGNVEIDGCQFTDITAAQEGSVSLKSCNATIANSQFANIAGSVSGGAAYFESSNASVSDCRFDNCSSYYGGAVYSQNGNATLRSSNFTDNTAWYGGATYGCDAVGCIFTRNYAEYSSGAMYGENNTATDCRFVENTAFNENPTSGITERNCIYTDNTVLKRGYLDTYYIATTYAQNDTLYIYLRVDSEAVYNATVTARAYDGGRLIKAFDFVCGNGLEVDIEPGEYVFEFSVENQGYVAEPVNVTVTVLKKEIAKVSIEIENSTYPDATGLEIMSNVDASLSIFIDEAYIGGADVTADNAYTTALNYIQAGNHTVKVIIYPSNPNIDSKTFTREFEVYKKQTRITLEVEDVTATDSLVVKVTASDDGWVSVKIGEITQNVYVSANTTAEIEFGILNEGSYDVTARLTAGENYIDSEDSKTLRVFSKISRQDIKITASDDSNDIAISLPGDAGGKVTLSIAGSYYDADVINGRANVALPNLTGENPYTITYSGDEKYAGFNISGTLNGDKSTVKQDIEDVEFDDVENIKLPDDAQGTITLTINGNEYVFDVVNGASNIRMPELEDGSYTYTIAYSGDEKYSSFEVMKNIVVKNPVSYEISAPNLKPVYSSGSYYTIKVTASNAKPVNGIDAVIKVNGKAFKTLTVKDGVCKFKVTQIPGTYSLSISVANSSIVRTLTVKHLVTLKAVTVKKSAKKLVLQATLGKVNGKFLKNKKITFKFNGKTYTAKTNNKGVAKVTIKSNVLKKLKVGKKVTYQATYSKDTVKKTVKAKK